MTRIGHGGDVYAAARELRRDLHQLLDFSASINPLGPSPAAVRILRAADALLGHYRTRLVGHSGRDWPDIGIVRMSSF